MTTNEFNQVLERRIDLIRQVLASKAKEYARTDRLHNFKVAASLSGVTAYRALWGMLAKHLVSVLDIIMDMDNIMHVPNKGHVDEKIGDCINYFILLEALLTERMGLTGGGVE